MARYKIRLLFKYQSGLIPQSTLDARTSKGIDLSALINLFSDDNDLSKSFPDQYFDEEKWGKCGYSYIEDNIRICQKCARLGLHLTIHQLKIFSLCPLHNCKLLSSCTKCGSDLGLFKIESPKNGKEIFNSFRCNYCGHKNIDFTKKISLPVEKRFKNKLAEFLNEYDSWIKNVNIRYSRNYYMDEIINNIIHEHLVKSCEPPTMKQYLESCHTDAPSKATYTKAAHDQLIIPKRLSHYPNESIELQALTFNLSRYADDFLRVLRKQFSISDKQLSTARMLRQYSDIFWGVNYSVWACAYQEIEDTVLFSYRQESQVIDSLCTQHWLIDCWYRYFACGLIKQINLSDKSDIFLLYRISRTWLKKFLTGLYLNQVGNVCKNLMDVSNQITHEKIVDKLNPFSSNDGIKFCTRENEKIIEIFFFQKGPKLSEAIRLFQSGFKGYTHDMRKNYENYKVLHRIFDADDRVHNYKEHVAMISKRSIVKLEL